MPNPETGFPQPQQDPRRDRHSCLPQLMQAWNQLTTQLLAA